jgi:DNA polymerase III psi subunit
MSVSEIKEKLHSAIDNISDEEFLKAILKILSNTNSSEYALTDKQIQLLKEEERRYLQGEGTDFSWEEAQALMRSGKLKP